MRYINLLEAMMSCLVACGSSDDTAATAAIDHGADSGAVSGLEGGSAMEAAGAGGGSTGDASRAMSDVGTAPVSDAPLTVTYDSGPPPACQGDNVVTGDVSSIEALRGVTDVQGNITLVGLKTLDLVDMTCLKHLKGNLDVTDSTTLLALHGLEGLADVGGGIKIQNNAQLVDGTALSGLRFVGSRMAYAYLTVAENKSLRTLDVGMLATVPESMHIDDNPLLVVLNFKSLSTVGAQLTITNDTSLASLHGLDALDSLGKSPSLLPAAPALWISGNRSLPACDAKAFHDALVARGFNGLTKIDSNQGTCP